MYFIIVIFVLLLCLCECVHFGCFYYVNCAEKNACDYDL